jgi:hypothetical protein
MWKCMLYRLRFVCLGGDEKVTIVRAAGGAERSSSLSTALSHVRVSSFPARSLEITCKISHLSSCALALLWTIAIS